MVHEVKFTRWRRLGHDLGGLLAESIAPAIARARQARPDFPDEIIVVPVPTSLRRRLRRGIDHPHVIARAVAKQLNARLCSHVIRRRHRRSQLHVLPSEREANVAGTFFPARKRGHDLAGTLVIVVDDVTTTGATLRGACRAVRRANREAGGGRLELWAAVLAVTEVEGEG